MSLATKPAKGLPGQLAPGRPPAAVCFRSIRHADAGIMGAALWVIIQTLTCHFRNQKFFFQVVDFFNSKKKIQVDF